MLVDVSEWRPDILAEHVEELESLWNRRLRAPRSPELEAVGLARLDQRLEAHTDALVLADEHALPLLEKALASEETPVAASAALALASSDAYGERLIDAFFEAPPAARAGMRAALELRAPPRLRQALAAKAGGASAELAVAVAAIAAAHGDPVSVSARRAWLEAPQVEVRRQAWRIEARFASARAVPAAEAPSQAEHVRGFDDADREVRRAALEAAARGGWPWLLDRLRAGARVPSVRAVDEHMLLAMIGQADDTDRLVALGRSAELGWYRYALLAVCGRAPAVEELLRTMRESAPVDAALAAAAFHRVTGMDVRRAERIPLVPAGADPDDLTDEIKACDAALAARSWDDARARMGGARWVRGEDADALAADALPVNLNLELRYALQLRAAFARPGQGARFDTEWFPFVA